MATLFRLLVQKLGPWAVKAATSALALKELWDWIRSGSEEAHPAATDDNYRRVAELAEALQAERSQEDDEKCECELEEADEFDQLERELEELFREEREQATFNTPAG